MLYITTYSNPDTDGVATAFGYRNWRMAAHGNDSRVVVFGRLQAETRFALEYTGYLKELLIVNHLAGDCTEIVLVDTHHPNQLDSSIRFDLVSEVIDHHSAGSPDCFSKATIQNEKVGAAATLMSERLMRSDILMDSSLALLLATAVYSNTLGFRAAATTARDHKAFAFLIEQCDWSERFVKDLEQARKNEMISLGEDVLFSDAKEFDTPIGKVIVFQVERSGIIDLFPEHRILELLHKRSKDEQRECVLVLVDLGLGKSQMYSTCNLILQALRGVAQGVRDPHTFVEVNFLVQRKTHIIPVMQTLKGS